MLESPRMKLFKGLKSDPAREAFGLLALSSLARLAFLGQRSLAGDEIWGLLTCRESLPRILELCRFDNYPPQDEFWGRVLGFFDAAIDSTAAPHRGVQQ